MQNEATFIRPAFLNDHPVVMRDKLFAVDADEKTYLAGSVLGVDGSGNLGMWTESSAAVAGILAMDVTTSADAETQASIYIHADVKINALVWDDSVTDDVKSSTAVPALREAGIYA